MSAATIRIFESELERIKSCVADSPGLETGGEMLGLWSHGDSPTVMLAGVTVMLAGGPAPDSRRGVTWFEQDAETHMELERYAWEEFGIQVVGLWHSHHQLSLHELSSGDVHRTQSYSQRHGRPRYSEILAYILDAEPRDREDVGGNGMSVGLRPHVYENAASGRAVPTRLIVLPGESPVRQALRKGPSRAVREVLGGRWHPSRVRIEHVVANHRPASDTGPMPATASGRRINDRDDDAAPPPADEPRQADDRPADDSRGSLSMVKEAVEGVRRLAGRSKAPPTSEPAEEAPAEGEPAEEASASETDSPPPDIPDAAAAVASGEGPGTVDETDPAATGPVPMDVIDLVERALAHARESGIPLDAVPTVDRNSLTFEIGAPDRSARLLIRVVGEPTQPMDVILALADGHSTDSTTRAAVDMQTLVQLVDEWIRRLGERGGRRVG